MILKSDLASADISLEDADFPNGRILPGVVQSISVNGVAQVDKASSNQGTAKSSRGLANKTVGITLLLVDGITEKAYAQLEELEKIFKDANEGLPKVFAIKNSHIKGRGIENMLFQSFSSSESSAGEEITVHLNFEEFTAAEASQGNKE